MNVEFYREILETKENIFYHGFLWPDNSDFIDLSGECDFCLGVSCSESQSAAMVTAMTGGIIPVCLDSMGIDIDACGGIRIKDAAVAELQRICRGLSLMERDEIIIRRKRACDYARENHSVKKYMEMLTKNLNEYYY